MKFFKKYKFTLTGILAGALCGYAYYHFIGCSSGTCPITSSPLTSTVYGALMGGLVFTSTRKPNSKP